VCLLGGYFLLCADPKEYAASASTMIFQKFFLAELGGEVSLQDGLWLWSRNSGGVGMNMAFCSAGNGDLKYLPEV
jgi:hypothetical protein